MRRAAVAVASGRSKRLQQLHNAAIAMTQPDSDVGIPTDAAAFEGLVASGLQPEQSMCGGSFTRHLACWEAYARIAERLGGYDQNMEDVLHMLRYGISAPEHFCLPDDPRKPAEPNHSKKVCRLADTELHVTSC